LFCLIAGQADDEDPICSSHARPPALVRTRPRRQSLSMEPQRR
jgi:hypothetical protein